MELTDRVSLVTGAARRLGRALALDLARSGSHIVVHYRESAEEARLAVSDIEALGVRAVALRADLTAPADVEALFDGIARELGRLDIVVNSAAGFVRRPFDEMTAAEWDRVFAINLRAPFQVMQHAARLMRSADRGAPGLVVNIADLSGVQVWRDYAAHGVSKAALLHLTKVAARELAPVVRVNAIVPGAILPPPGMTAESDEWRDFGERLPLQRTGEPGQVGHAVRFLAENDFVTGAVLFVDGGEHLGGPRRH